MKLSKLRKELEEEHEIIEYEDTNVRELLTLMKDNSELIADLAYAGIVFENEDLAEEVRHLESEMDKMMYQIRLKCMLSARTIEDAEQLSGLLQIASAAEKLSDASEDMVKLLDMDLELKKLLPHIMREADERIHTLKVSQKSDMANKKIGDLHLESVTGIRIIAIRRKSRWIYGPNGHTLIKGDDMLITRGVEEGYKELKPIAQGEKRWEA
ncbi:MAG: potassium channel family protein [Thermoplasmatota archaeon]